MNTRACGLLKLKKLKIDALIPSRSGSKGLYRKSMVLLGRKPLIEYTIEAASAASFIRHVYLSTDDKDILKKYGDRKRIKSIDRPAVLAQDAVSIKDVILHAIKKMGTNKPDLLVVLFPTAPLRTSKHINSAIQFADSLPVFDSVVSVSRIKVSPYGGIAVTEGNKIEPKIKDSYKYYRRQDQPPVYTLNGAIFIINCSRINKLNDLLLSDRSYAFKMDESESVDVDMPYDVAIAQAMLAFREERIDPNSRGGFNVQRLYVYDDQKANIRRNVFDATVYERHFKRYKFFLQYISSSDSVLDIACGSGYGSQILASKARSVHGVDADPKTIEYARSHYAGNNIRFDVSPAETFVPANKYDKVISIETIEHLVDPDAFLERVKGWLKPGGELWLTCPLNQDRENNIESPFHISELTKERLNGIMNRCFKDVKLFELNEGDLFAADSLKNQVTFIVAKGTNR